VNEAYEDHPVPVLYCGVKVVEVFGVFVHLLDVLGKTVPLVVKERLNFGVF